MLSALPLAEKSMCGIDSEIMPASIDHYFDILLGQNEEVDHSEPQSTQQRREKRLKNALDVIMKEDNVLITTKNRDEYHCSEISNAKEQDIFRFLRNSKN